MKYFDLDLLPNLTEVDFFLSLGNASAQRPLRLNGQNFSLKFAILTNVNTRQMKDIDQGVFKRIRPQ